MSFLLLFPAEISLIIIEQLDFDDVRCLSYCSKFCYNFLLRVRFPSITLNRYSIPLFQDGGVCESSRGVVQSIRWECNLSEAHQPAWRHRMRDLKSELRNDTEPPNMRSERVVHDVENLITQIRANIAVTNLFPNIHELYISYQIPPSIANNIFTVIIQNLGPDIWNNLQHLDFQCYRHLSKFYMYRRSMIDYETIYSRLSPESQEFLGENITSDEIRLVIAKTGPKILPSLTKATITLNSIRAPISDTLFFEKSAFYYIPFSRAPNLENLCVRVAGVYEPRYGCDEGFDEDILKIFGGVSTVKILKWLMGPEKPKINTYRFGYEA